MASLTTAQNLEQIRRRNGITLNQIADSTKISVFFLQAIETEQYGKLPGGVFTRSYIRQYAAAVGIPAKDLLDSYAEYEAEKERQANAPEDLRRKTSGLRWLGSLLASCLGCAVL
jgi:cytoskeletal protein RodZ